MDQYFENNRQLWNRRTSLHRDTDFYDLQGFKEGKSALKSIEREALGNVEGKSLLHLQCHFGLDSLSWERLGARVTAVDFSEEAIKLAQQLRDEQQLQTEFICANVYDLPQHLNRSFDIVFTSYGVICWLPDLNRWGELVARYLKPGGVFYMVEFHPMVMMFDEVNGDLKYSYFHEPDPHTQQMDYTYANPQEALDHKEHSWNHSLADTVNALTEQGLIIEELQEYPFTSYNCFSNLEQDDDGYYYEKHRKGKMPLMFSIRAQAPTL